MSEEDLIKEFSRKMVEKLRLRKNRYVPFAWKTMDLKRLILLLKEEVTELEEACGAGDLLHIASETVDVANYAMFILEMAKDPKEFT